MKNEKSQQELGLILVRLRPATQRGSMMHFPNVVEKALDCQTKNHEPHAHEK